MARSYKENLQRRFSLHFFGLSFYTQQLTGHKVSLVIAAS